MLEGSCFLLDQRQIATGYKQVFVCFYLFYFNPLGPKFRRGKIDVHAKCFLDGLTIALLGRVIKKQLEEVWGCALAAGSDSA